MTWLENAEQKKASLELLPIEIIYIVASYLPVSDFVSFIRSSNCFNKISFTVQQVQEIEDLFQSKELFNNTDLFKRYLLMKYFDYTEAFRYAIWKPHPEIVALLLKYEKVDPSADGNIALISAIRLRHLEIVQMLLNDSRVDPSANTNVCIGVTYSYGKPAITRMLKSNGK
ncbi:hypothetical protein HDV02_000625, partial [Globomyces sp. JEL0801]